QEALLDPAPLISDLIEFAHGPFQAFYERAATFVLLQRSASAFEGELLTRLRSMLHAQHHRLLPLPAEAPGAHALFEHEVLLKELGWAPAAAGGSAQARWRGRDRDRPLYEVAEPVAEPQPDSPAIKPAPTHSTSLRSLDALTWPQLEELIAAGCRTAVLPL